MRKSLMLLIISAFLTACGHKGPLYLPGDKPAAGKRGTTPPSPPPAPPASAP